MEPYRILAVASTKSGKSFRVVRQDVYRGEGEWAQVHEVEAREAGGEWTPIYPASLLADTAKAMDVMIRAKARAELDECIARYMRAPASNEPADAFDAVELAVGGVR